jgi:hypothetical protein
MLPQKRKVTKIMAESTTSTTYKKVKRSKFMSFLNTGTSTAPTWSRMGKGITGQEVAYNPQTTTECYIDEDNATTDIDYYQPSIQTPQTVYAGEPCFAYVDNLRKNRATGDDAKSEILLVDAYSASNDSYSAERNNCSIQIDTFGGDGGKPLSITYTINLCGDPVTGTFNASTKAFTAST